MWVKGHLQKAAKEIKRERPVEIFELAQKNKEKYKDTLNKSEIIFLKNTLTTKNIPNPKLIIKGHTKANSLGG